MKKALALTGLAALMVAAPASAQSAKISGLAQVWYTQMQDSELRTASEMSSPYKYYPMRSEFKENGFYIRRVEVKVAGEVLEGVKYDVMVDPTRDGNILQDAVISYQFPLGVGVKVGQFKTLQTLEGATSSSELIFAERSMIGRTFGDERQRGGVLSLKTGDPKGLAAVVQLGVFNGTKTSSTHAAANDLDPQKEFVARLDMSYEKLHKFGFYTMQGRTDKDDAGLTALTFAGVNTPSASEIRDNKDKSTNYGIFYAFQNDTWYASAEAITGLVGRRFASLGSATGSAARQHLDQKYMGFVATGAYTTGNHTFAARYDCLNYNQGDDWYTAYNPYTETAVGVSAGRDYTPKYTELTLGYTYAFKPEKVKAANIKINYIMRSNNILKSSTGAEVGGNSLVAAFQVAF